MHVAALAGVYLAQRFLRPLSLLAQSARKVGDQLWGQTVPVSGSDEIGEGERIDGSSVAAKVFAEDPLEYDGEEDSPFDLDPEDSLI